MSNVYALAIEAHAKASYCGDIKSMRDGFASHFSKAADYRRNIRDAASEEEQVKLAFLIEAHVDYSDLFLNSRTGVRKLHDGEAIVFRNLEEEITKASKEVDYLILAFYPALTDDIADAVCINCRSLRQSLARNRIQLLPYFGPDRFMPVYSKSNVTPHIEDIESDGSVVYTFETQVEEMPYAAELAFIVRDLPTILSYRADKRAFVTSSTMQLFLDVFGDTVEASKRLSFDDFIAVRNALGYDTIRKRVREWCARWFPDVNPDTGELSMNIVVGR